MEKKLNKESLKELKDAEEYLKMLANDRKITDFEKDNDSTPYPPHYYEN